MCSYQFIIFQTKKFVIPMTERNTTGKWRYPLSKQLVAYINIVEPDLAPRLTSAIELAIMESSCQEEDLCRMLEPLLHDDTEIFVKSLLDRISEQPHDEHAHNLLYESEFTRTHPADTRVKRVHFDLSNLVKPAKEGNPEVVFNKVDEDRFSQDEIREYASGYGTVNLLRRLNRGKYLIVFSTADAAREILAVEEPVLGDPRIRKFPNSPWMPQDKTNKKVEINTLLQTQDELLDKLSVSYDKGLMRSLKNISKQIRSYVLSKENSINRHVS